MLGSDVLNTVFDLADVIVSGLKSLYDYLSLPLTDFIQRILPIPDALMGFLGNLGEIPTFGFLFGSGIVVILAYNLVSWVIDVLP